MEKIIIDADRFLRTISRISHEIIEKHQDFDNVIFSWGETSRSRNCRIDSRRIEELNGISSSNDGIGYHVLPR